MRVKWLGHACFLITTEAGVRIITDPYLAGGGIKYEPVKESADIVTISHGHADHNNASVITGRPEVITEVGIREVRGVVVKGIATHHDESAGKERGNNIAFCFSVDGMNLCHLGDLGHPLTEQQISDIGKMDILLIPVGGFFTINADVANQVCNDLMPRVIVPMHYKTSKLDYPVAGVADFLSGKKNVKYANSSEVKYSREQMPEVTEIVVLEHAL